MSGLYDVTDMLNVSTAIGEWEDNPRDNRAIGEAVLDDVAPRIIARAQAQALRDLVRFCFDENDAAVTVGGIETVETYVFDKIAELTGDDADTEAANQVRALAQKTFARKTGWPESSHEPVCCGSHSDSGGRPCKGCPE